MLGCPHIAARITAAWDIGEARGRGRELWAQVGRFPLGMEFQLRHPYPLEAFLAWQPAILAEGSDAFLDVLRGSELRAALKAEAGTATVPNRFSYHSPLLRDSHRHGGHLRQARRVRRTPALGSRLSARGARPARRLALTGPDTPVIEPLARRHDRTAFSCGLSELDRYLARQAGQDVRRRIARVFVCTAGEADAVLGFYTLNSSLC